MPSAPIGRLEAPKCSNPLSYTTSEWCGQLKDAKGPWSECLKLADQEVVNEIYENCVNDLCAWETSKTRQALGICEYYEQIVDGCYELAKAKNLSMNLLWREKTECGNIF